MPDRVHGGTRFEALGAYCRAIRTGPLITVSGTAALGEDGAILHPGDAFKQAKVALERTLKAAEELGAAREDVIHTRLYFTPEANVLEAMQAHREVFAECPPANTTVLVAGLPPAGALVEVELQAWVAS